MPSHPFSTMTAGYDGGHDSDWKLSYRVLTVCAR